MNLRNHILPILLILFSLFSAEAGIIQFYDSPDGLTFLYLKAYKGKHIPLLTLNCGKTQPIGAPSNVEFDYDMLTGKKKHCRNFYEERKFLLSDGDTLYVRTYKDGLAWKKSGTSKIRFIDPEHTWLQNWTDCYEGFFPKDPELKEGQRIGYPALVEYKDGIFGLLTESGITPEEAGVSMYSLGGDSFDLKPDGLEDGGWQIFIVGSLSDIVESTLVTDVAAPNKLDDTSWIEPGVASW
ncbi:MAG: glycoside hydrolase family 97 N-terminal domain-containing protein, partial [Muribaculaceae bacterium]|nr:glycoside hydrolase family 97 N-terminal domain-containing protein [Muribaculaceae bacterium]